MRRKFADARRLFAEAGSDKAADYMLLKAALSRNTGRYYLESGAAEGVRLAASGRRDLPTAGPGG